VIDQPGVSTVIPGASSPEQVLQNIAAASLEPLREEQVSGVREVYDRLIREHVHSSW
jgi:aryl-alcohol dehydrogenase-like predicted oxidoreductase